MQVKTQWPAKKDSKVGKETLKVIPQRLQSKVRVNGRQGRTQRHARKDSKTGKVRLKGRQGMTQRQARDDSKAGKG